MARKESTNVLSGEWINARVDNVLDQVEEIIDHLLVDGVLSSGFPPLAKQVDKQLVRRMTKEQFAKIMENVDIDGQAIMDETLRDLNFPST
jgi:hypothetical protein